MKQEIYSNKAPEPIGPYSQCIKHGNLIFISGQIAINRETNKIISNNILDETKMVMENLKYILEKCNCSFKNVVKCSIFLSDLNLFDDVNKIYSKYFSEPYPARETIEVSKLPKNVNLEISAIAISK
ncbi:Rid family detoxifying hydrolase [Bacteroidota bacterium]|nr:Rid family detoxifying hydrolase [Bacteroidota bacterium]MEC8538077.1 Rid family detoxifying hydrolase [Bacteroidota bacterium]